MYKANANVMSYLNPKKAPFKSKKTSLEVLKIVWKWVKILGFLFIIISMFWGCVQMYQKDYTVYQVVDMTGRKVYAPGTAFEIIIRSLGEMGGKNHIVSGDLQEYGFNGIMDWGDAFSKTHSPFYGFFVYPMAFVLVGILKGFSGTLNPGLDAASQKSYGIAAFFAIFFTVLIVRSITLLFTWKSQVNQEKMQSLQLKQAEIQAKYKDKKDLQGKQKQQAETMALYKKEGLSPMAAMSGTFASMPFLFAMFAIIRSTRALKIANIGKISLIEAPWERLTHGEPVYLALLAVYLPLQMISMLLPTLLQYVNKKSKTLTEAQRKARKKNLIMQLVFMVIFIIIVATISSGVAIYWILSSTFQIGQTLGFFFYNQKKNAPGSRERDRRLRQMSKRKNNNLVLSK
ncbi:YidC/Oxa1 family membrane protein insertase [Entomoplasma freundtii]|uniref:Membrane protein insertase YidC n=1 Tax=Entomoplasma freundtii TaxID=74700 RepID=A0A2K8NSI1_9MOLU|nr:membrane protein insertase YidC [Entomoplasma freundtii]ATZ16727.1 membrane protein insertase YidC [Entomoplasma freundtii]TDY58106.1 YidC/Oxa1 family membrane protein insertase [Entomoplasma freundtii]